MIAFIDAHREIYGVEPICRVLPIAPSTYHAHAARWRDPRTPANPGAAEWLLASRDPPRMGREFPVLRRAKSLAAIAPGRDSGCAMHDRAADAAFGCPPR
jgi:hypothetical protein